MNDDYNTQAFFHKIIETEYELQDLKLFEREGELLISEIQKSQIEKLKPNDIKHVFKFIDPETFKLTIEVISLIVATLNAVKEVKSLYSNHQKANIENYKHRWKAQLLSQNIKEAKANRIVEQFGAEFQELLRK